MKKTVADNRKKERLFRFISVALALMLWQLCAMLFHSRIVLATPVDVVKKLAVIWREEGFFTTLLSSFVRIAGGFFAGAAAGILLAIPASRFRRVEILLHPYITVLKTVPVASFVIVALMLFSSVYLSFVIAAIMTMPILYTNALTGLHSVDRHMLEMARVFRLSYRKKLGYILIPSLKPYLLSAVSIAAGLSFKSGVAAEVIGLPRGSVGEMFYYAKLYLSSADLLAWTVWVVLLSLAFEKVLITLIRWAFKRWEARQ